MDIDKLTRSSVQKTAACCFSTLLDIDKLTHAACLYAALFSFSTLLDIDNVVMITVYFSFFKLLATCDLRQILL